MTALIQSNSAYSRIADPHRFIKEMGVSIAQSGMFGCENERQGEVLAMACLARRLDPMSIPQEYHLMHGRLVLRADAMLGRLSRAGGSYIVISHTADCAEIEVEYKGRKYRERLTWDDAKQEPFVYEGKPKDIMPALLAKDFSKLKLSSNYATPRRRMQHLWARVCSDAVRVIAPDLVTGNYTPEEATEFTGKPIPAAIENAPPATVEALEAAEAMAERAAIQEYDGQTLKELNDRKAAVMSAKDDAEDAVIVQPATGQATTAQPTAAATSTTLAEPAVFQRNMSERIDEAEVESLKELIKQTSQLPGCEKLHLHVREMFTSQGLKFADLSWNSARELRHKIERKELEAMAGLMLIKGGSPT